MAHTVTRNSENATAGGDRRQHREDASATATLCHPEPQPDRIDMSNHGTTAAATPSRYTGISDHAEDRQHALRDVEGITVMPRQEPVV